jgi:hypothetical protein
VRFRTDLLCEETGDEVVLMKDSFAGRTTPS